MRIENCHVGNESKSGQAVLVEIDGEEHWVPLSVVNSIRRDPRVNHQDAIDIEDWWCRKNGIDS